MRDTGQGIAAEQLPGIFDPFGVAHSTTQSHGGLGLGLAIVRHLVELHGGTVKAESAGPGQGATFTVTLPLTDERPADEAEAVAIAAPAVAAGRLPALDGDPGSRRGRRGRRAGAGASDPRRNAEPR